MRDEHSYFTRKEEKRPITSHLRFERENAPTHGLLMSTVLRLVT